MQLCLSKIEPRLEHLEHIFSSCTMYIISMYFVFEYIRIAWKLQLRWILGMAIERERQRGREGGREREKERVAWKKKRGWQFLSTHMDSMKSSEGSQSSRPSSVLALALAPWVLSSSDFEMKGLQAEVAFLLQDPFKARSVRSRPAS